MESAHENAICEHIRCLPQWLTAVKKTFSFHAMLFTTVLILCQRNPSPPPICYRHSAHKYITHILTLFLIVARLQAGLST